MSRKVCSICLEQVTRPARLNLICECKYDTHHSCFNTWWEKKNECIICHSFCYKADKYYQTTPVRKQRPIINPIRTYNTIYIHDNYIIALVVFGWLFTFFQILVQLL